MNRAEFNVVGEPCSSDVTCSRLPSWYAAERESLAFTEYAFCTGAACASIAPHASERLDYNHIAGYHRGAREAVVFHFRLVPAAGGGVRADSIRGLVVRL
jgi:hypothetical protein